MLLRFSLAFIQKYRNAFDLTWKCYNFFGNVINSTELFCRICKLLFILKINHVLVITFCGCTVVKHIYHLENDYFMSTFMSQEGVTEQHGLTGN